MVRFCPTEEIYVKAMKKTRLMKQAGRKMLLNTRRGVASVDIYGENYRGQDIIMLHGCGGSKITFSSADSGLAPFLSQATKSRVITVDWYGHGDSQHLGQIDEPLKDLFLEQLDDVVCAFIEPEGTFDLYAFSMGAYLACHYLETHNNRIKRLVLHSPWNAEVSAFSPHIQSFLETPGRDHFRGPFPLNRNPNCDNEKQVLVSPRLVLFVGL